MDFNQLDWSHALSGFYGSAFTGALALAGFYFWLNRERQKVASAQLVIDKDRLVVDDAKDAAQKKRDDTATAAWRELYEGCEKYRTALAGKIEDLVAQVMDLKVRSAEKDGRIALLEARIAQLEKVSPACTGCPLAQATQPGSKP